MKNKLKTALARPLSNGENAVMEILVILITVPLFLCVAVYLATR
jgi:hypothetical protein